MSIVIWIGGGAAFIGAIAYLLSDLDENGEPREYME
jgi:hypothetical protein